MQVPCIGIVISSSTMSCATSCLALWHECALYVIGVACVFVKVMFGNKSTRRRAVTCVIAHCMRFVFNQSTKLLSSQSNVCQQVDTTASDDFLDRMP